MSQANNRGGSNKRSRLSSSGAYRQRESQSSSLPTNVAQTQSGLTIDQETELSSDAIKEQLNTVEDIITQPIIEVPTKRLLHLKELGGNLFVSSSTKIYSKTLQKLFDRVLFTKSLNNDANTAPSDLRVFERVLARSDDNDAYSTCTSLAQPTPATILVLGSSACEQALIWKLSQRRNFKIFSSLINNTSAAADQTPIFQTEKEVLDFVDARHIDLVISLNKMCYFEELEARLGEHGLHYLGCSVDTLALSENQLNAKQFMNKHKIPTLEWSQCSTMEDAESYVHKFPTQQQWIVRATVGNGAIFCKTPEETLQTVRAVFQDEIFGKLNQSIILEHGYSADEHQVCVLYIVSDGDGDYTQLPIVQSDPSRLGAYGPCPYLTSKQLSFIRRRIVERTLRCSPTIRHLFGFRLLIQGNNYNEICLLDYLATFDEPDAEILLSLCEPDIFLQYALDLPSVSIIPLMNKKRRVHCVNITMTSNKDSVTIPSKVLSTAAKTNKVKIFQNQTETNLNNNGTGGSGDAANIISNGERILNVLGYGSTLQEAQTQAIQACEYIKQNVHVEELIFKPDIGIQAIEWYKTHFDRHNSSAGGLTNGNKKKLRKKKSSPTSAKRRRRMMKNFEHGKGGENELSDLDHDDEDDDNDDDDDDDDDEEDNEPMDFERAFGSSNDLPKLEHMDVYQNNAAYDDLHSLEGDSFYDLQTKIDLKTFTQPVLISSTINLNPLAALFNLNDSEMSDNQTVFEYLGHELTVRCANDLIFARTLYVQFCSSPVSSRRSIQRFYQGIEQACQQLDCSLLKTTSFSSPPSTFNAFCTGVCDRESIQLNNNPHPMINEGDFLIALRCSSGTVNSQGYLQLKELFQKKNIHLNDTVPFRTVDGDEESFFSLLLQKSSILANGLVKTITDLIKNRTIKAIRYLKDIGLARMIESLLGPASSNLSAELNGQQWPVMPPLFTWIYQQSGFSQDEMFEHFNCGVDYMLIVDHSKTTMDEILQQLTGTHVSSFFLGIFISNNVSPARKTIRVPQQPVVNPPRPRTVQLKNVSFKYPKPYQTAAVAALNNNNSSLVIKDRMKQPIANDKTRCAVLISSNDTSLLALLAYSSSTLECAFEIVLVLSTLASLSDIARVNELYPSVVTKVIQPKKYAARHYDLDQKVDDELQLHGCELVILDRYACRLSSSFMTTWRGRLLMIYPSLLPAFRHSSSPIRDALQAGVRITGVTVHFIGESDTDNEGPIIAQESIAVMPTETEVQLETRLRILEQQLYPRAIDMVASGKIVYQGRRRIGKTNSTPATYHSSTY